MGNVSISDVRKSYGTTEVVHGINIEINDGEFVALVGPSGCGKSTMLRMIAGLEHISSGEISIGGSVVNKLEPKDRDIAMVFQNYALYPHMTVRENMSYGLKVRRFPKDEITRRVNTAAEILGLGDYLSRKPGQLSGGQRQRVAMGRAIVREPSVFLFDEPLSNLDAKLRNQMRIELKRLHRRLATTSVYVTHDQVEAMTLADRIVVLNEGSIEQAGRPIEVYEKPATTFVARFIGSPAMNIFDAEADSGGVVLNQDLRINDVMTNNTEKKVLVGIRPEHLTLGNGGGDISFDAAVELMEPLGSDTVIHCVLDGNGKEVTARIPGAEKVSRGDSITLSADKQHIHLFSSESGKRI